MSTAVSSGQIAPELRPLWPVFIVSALALPLLWMLLEGLAGPDGVIEFYFVSIGAIPIAFAVVLRPAWLRIRLNWRMRPAVSAVVAMFSLPSAAVFVWGVYCLVWLVFVVLPAEAATDRTAVERQFQKWIAAEIWPEAKAAKVSRATFDAAFAGVTLDWSMPELTPPGQPVKPPAVEWQAEFRAPGAYFNEKTLATLAGAGRAQLVAWRKTLTAIEKKYGVPASILLAIWAKETGYGSAALPKPAIRALATEAFMGRRADFFRVELIDALTILQNGDIAPGEMRSSVAGALGQPQFMPSQFVKYAVDFDGDGKRDIWDSVPDTLASIARYLLGEGWVKGVPWGQEVVIPASVACSLEGPEQGQPLQAWLALGIRTPKGGTIRATDSAPRYPLMPAGRFGPAFLVSDNFYVLKKYNYSDLYALYIGHLADRIAGKGAPFSAAWGKVGGFSRGDVKAMQDALVKQGYDVGNADGLVGFKTRVAIGLWQAKHGDAQTCFPDAGHIRNIR